MQLKITCSFTHLIFGANTNRKSNINFNQNRTDHTCTTKCKTEEQLDKMQHLFKETESTTQSQAKKQIS